MKYKYQQLFVKPSEMSDTANAEAKLGWELFFILPPTDGGPLGSVCMLFRKAV